MKSANLLRLTLVLLLLGVGSFQLFADPEPNSEEPEYSEEAEAAPQDLAHVFRDTNPPVIPVQPRAEISPQTVLIIALFLAAMFQLGQVVYRLNKRFNLWSRVTAEAADPSESVLAEDQTLASFFTELRDGLAVAAPPPEALDPLNAVPLQTSAEQVRAAADPLRELFDSGRKQIAVLQTVFSEISRAPDEVARQERLLEFLHQVGRLKDLSEIPELRPVWLMACGLEGLFKQLSNKLSNISPSVLETATGAIDLLGDLCVRGLNPNLAAEPPIRLLAVDDDAVSRLAMTFALRKAFSEPDVAPEGQTALGMAAQQTYDVIFLDVEMPGMDGFELCTKIHETILNKTTPVIFVTRHSDFNSRAKSTRCGGQHLIGKPFLSSEITVKALTVALRARLEKSAESVSASKAASRKTVPVKAARASKAPAAIAPSAKAASLAAPSGAEPSARTEKQKDPNSESNTGTSAHPNPLSSAASNDSPATENASDQLNDRKFPASFNPGSSDLAHAFFTHAPGQLEKLRRHLEAAQRASEPAELRQRLGELYVGIHSFNAQAERAELRAASRLASALEGMLKKLLEHAKYCTPSALNAAASALEVLEELCAQAGSGPDLAHPPPHILVVDDDPLTCRAIAGSIQLAFGRPDSAENGEAALALAAEKSFDLIFLDVLMPGIDGFTTCSKIHETAPNRCTPVVFVTSRDDADSRAQAIVSGGCGFIPKPVLASQITLTALTFILRARLTQPALAPVPAPEPAACLAIA